MAVSRSYLRHLVNFHEKKKRKMKITFFFLYTFFHSYLFLKKRHNFFLHLSYFFCIWLLAQLSVQLSAQLFHSIIHLVIWCFPVWHSSFIMLSEGGLQCKFIRTFCYLTWKWQTVIKLKKSERPPLKSSMKAMIGCQPWPIFFFIVGLSEPLLYWEKMGMRIL